MGYGVGIVGVGHRLPARAETNEALCARFPAATPAWILEKSGVERRYRAADDEPAALLATDAARAALANAGVDPLDLGLIVVCTYSADDVFPPASARVQHALGAKHAAILDLQANCAGFVAGLTVASDRMRLDPTIKHALVVGVERQSRFVAADDLETAMTFSDGAGAAVLGQVAAGAGVLDAHFHADGGAYEALRLPRGGTIEATGATAWQQAVAHLPGTVRRACEKAGVALAEVDLFVFHQASEPLIYYVLRKLGQPVERTHTNVASIGNTGAASVAIALSEAVAAGRLRPGQTLVLAAVGAGFNFGASVWRWGGR